MPEVLCLDENPQETIRFIGLLRSRALQGAVDSRRGQGTVRKFSRIPIVDDWFDFGTMKRIGVSAALVLAAIYDRQKSIVRRKLSTINEHLWQGDVRSVLHSLGFHELLEMQKGTNQSPRGDVRILRFKSGSLADGETAGWLQQGLAELLPDDERQKLLFAEPYAGIMEAILNSHSWAYPDGTTWDFPQLKRWWITGAVDLSSNVVEVIVFDQGVTIPHSLPKWRHWGELRRRLERISQRVGFGGDPEDPANDAAAIALATKIARTSTGLPQHGKGLHTMFEVAQRARHGRLRIISRFGEYVWETGKRPFIHPLTDGLSGTLIHWTLEL